MSDTKKGKGKYVRPIEVLAQVVASGKLYWADAEVTRFYKEPSPGFWANYPGGNANFWETDEGKLWRYKKDFDVWPVEIRTLEFGWLSVPVLRATDDGFMVKSPGGEAEIRDSLVNLDWRYQNPRPIHCIGREIRRELGKYGDNIPFHPADSYAQLMLTLTDLNDRASGEGASSIIRSFLNASRNWRDEAGRRIRNELRRRIGAI